MKRIILTLALFVPGLLLMPQAWAASAKAPKKEPPPKPVPCQYEQGTAPRPIQAGCAVTLSTAAVISLPLYEPTTAPLTVELVMERFEEFDRALKTISTDFQQMVRWDETGVTQVVEGRLDYRKKDRIHLVHRLPEPQTMVSDGTWLWIHRRSTNQVIRTRLEDWKKSEPLAQGLMDFGNYAELLRRYQVEITTVSAAKENGHRDIELRLTPKSKKEAGDFTLLLRLSTADFFPADAELRVGQIMVRSRFNNVSFNPPMPDSLFEFAPPDGADVFMNFKPPVK